jgi:hypothetical protein
VQVPSGTGSSVTLVASASSDNTAPAISGSRSDTSNNSRRTAQSGRSRTFGGTTTSSTPAASATVDSEEEEDVNVKNARTLFTALDVDKDGNLTEEEWNRSRLARQQFQAAGVELGLPVSLEQFTVKYVEMKSKN